MEFNEKLQELRKQRGLTQEELAQALYVSRTAVSKWESGRGYPNIDSLKAIAQYFSVTIDELLSSGEVLTIAEEDHQQKAMRARDQVFGLLDVSTVMFFFLPLFGQRLEGAVQAVSLLALTGSQPYVRIAYWGMVIGLALLGIVTLAMQNVQQTCWTKNKHRLSVVINSVGLLLFIISSQPYAAVLLFIFLLIKLLMLSKPR